jgi:hypothetical protein
MSGPDLIQVRAVAFWCHESPAFDIYNSKDDLKKLLSVLDA